MIISTKTRVQVSVPSRGNGVIDVKRQQHDVFDVLSFRPLSGKWGYRFDALMNALYDALYAKFPSPLGEMGLSIKMESSRFPSLSKFPSPLGEMGLSINVRLRVKRWLICVSVPSRGNGVIDLNRAIYNHFCFRRVSVPSRGNGVIDQKGFRRGSRRARWFPSPLGEMGLSIWNEMRHFAAGMRFPSPLGEMGLSIHDVAARKRVPSPSFRPLSGKWGYRFAQDQDGEIKISV